MSSNHENPRTQRAPRTTSRPQARTDSKQETQHAPQGAPRRVQRRVNLLNTFRQLTSAQTISSLSTQINVSRPAVERIVADLDNLGWVKQLAPDNSFGRPATRWALNANTVHVLGLDIGAHHCTAMVGDLFGEVLSELTVDLDAKTPAQQRLLDATEAGCEAVKAAGLSIEDITLCAVASPGVVNEGVVTYYGGSGMPDWRGTNIAQEVSAVLGCETVVAGDCALGALGESWRGAAEGHDDVVYILSGERTGGAAIINGQIHRGLQGAAGLIGELTPIRWKDIEAETCAKRVYETNEITSRTEIFNAARAGESKALEVIDDFANALSLGAAAMVLTLAPSHLVVGGKYSAFSDLFLERFVENLRHWCPVMPQVSASALGPRAICLGALRLGLDTLFAYLENTVVASDVFPSAEGFKKQFQA
ncbi:ROK family protein [Gleimia hominis]|uniref:ROK family protein n=1 Tax=Gleimia hominis TaxID=595468 RepID=UPI000C7FE8E5|nr:ROK family protein [Gleimia hominis]WIK63907.1 ROK family protein [Gleimia hominis]